MSIDAQPRQIRYVPVDDTVRAESNPKDHDVEYVKTLIRRFGFVDGAIHDGRTDRIIAGHGRLEALQEMQDAGEDAPDGILVDPHGRWLWGVQYGWASRTDAEAMALNTALNQSTTRGGWHVDELVEHLDALREQDAGLFDLAGFTDTELEEMRVSLGVVPGDEPDFSPEDGDQARLDQREATTCPSCSFSWRVGPRGEVEPC